MRRALGVGVLLALAAPAAAFVPSVHRVLAGVASANAEAGRGQGLRLDVVLKRPDGLEEATGALWLDPGGTAYLELRAPDGSVEVHLVRNGTHRAARNGQPLPEPRPLLPPPRLLQAESPDQLRGALLQLGADPDRIDLGLDGEDDCFVLGGRRLGAPDAAERPTRGAFWVDTNTLQPRRIDLPDGVRFRLGPPPEDGKIRFPSFVDVETLAGRWRLELGPAVRARLPASAH